MKMKTLNVYYGMNEWMERNSHARIGTYHSVKKKHTSQKVRCRRLIFFWLYSSLCVSRFCMPCPFGCVIICVIFCREPFPNMSVHFCVWNQSEAVDLAFFESDEHTFSIASVWRDTPWCAHLFHLVIDAEIPSPAIDSVLYLVFILFMIEFLFFPIAFFVVVGAVGVRLDFSLLNLVEPSFCSASQPVFVWVQCSPLAVFGMLAVFSLDFSWFICYTKYLLTIKIEWWC